MLTRKQYELLMFIQERLRQTGVSPSFDEMKEALNLRSKSGIHRLITGLAERGFIRRLAHRARALEVVRMPENAGPAERAPAASPAAAHAGPGTAANTQAFASPPAAAGNGGFAPNVIRGNFQPAVPAAAVPAEPTEAVRLPLLGKIAAGAPIEALSNPSNSIDIPASLLSRGEHFALTVEGDSMIDAGIYDGDTAVIQRCDTADNGAIVVALVDSNEVTLKRLRRKHGSIALEPANPVYETRIFGPDRVQVQGKLVGLLRRY
ncbi:MAG: transcriptional repressor LexA [Alphaproteobacteria bacterium]|nr:transcriptional repressor LexA [Alphaproteobacteria bacterium]